MSKPILLVEFEKKTTNKLLKTLLETYNPSPEISKEQKVLILVAKLDKIYEERVNETNKH